MGAVPIVSSDGFRIVAGRWQFFADEVTFPGHQDTRFWQLHRVLDGQGAAAVFPSPDEHWKADSREAFMEFAWRWVEENAQMVAPDLV